MDNRHLEELALLDRADDALRKSRALLVHIWSGLAADETNDLLCLSLQALDRAYSSIEASNRASRGNTSRKTLSLRPGPSGKCGQNET
jgi:hypothetical protein